MADLIDTGGWVPLLDTTVEGPFTSDASTQTEGLFYPSSRTISKAMAATEAVLTSWSVKRPQTGAYSPGRGNSMESLYYSDTLDHFNVLIIQLSILIIGVYIF